MKVIALGDRGKTVGYYDHRRRKGGDVFELAAYEYTKKVRGKKDELVKVSAADQFSKAWMEKVGKGDDAPAASEKKTFLGKKVKSSKDVI